MPKHVRPIGHDDRLSVVDHLDELRSRLIVCAAALLVMFGLCFWQSGNILTLLNHPLTHLNKQAKDELGGTSNNEVHLRSFLLNASSDAQQLARTNFTPKQSALFEALSSQLKQGAEALPAKTTGVAPLTLGVGEPFTQTVKVAIYFALLITLPLLLYELFAFVVPALEDREKKVVIPLLVIAPVLFFAGCVFTYLVVLPPAIKFLQGYNSSHFESLIQASPYYSFEVLTMAAIGLAFEMPLVLLGARAIGLIDGRTLTKHWRYSILTIAVVVAAMPGSDPVTTGLEAAPLLVLYFASIVLLRLADRRARKREAAEAAQMAASGIAEL